MKFDPSYYEMTISLYAWESGWEPHWQGASEYKLRLLLKHDQMLFYFGIIIYSIPFINVDLLKHSVISNCFISSTLAQMDLRILWICPALLLPIHLWQWSKRKTRIDFIQWSWNIHVSCCQCSMPLFFNRYKYRITSLKDVLHKYPRLTLENNIDLQSPILSHGLSPLASGYC